MSSRLEECRCFRPSHENQQQGSLPVMNKFLKKLMEVHGPENAISETCTYSTREANGGSRNHWLFRTHKKSRTVGLAGRCTDDRASRSKALSRFAGMDRADCELIANLSLHEELMNTVRKK